MTTMLVVLIFLLADGSPASKARVVCQGLDNFAAGDDQGARGNDELIIDSRGGTIIEGSPQTITCEAWKAGQHWAGSITLEHDLQQIRIYLQEPQ